jgi:hypothetical protein
MVGAAMSMQPLLSSNTVEYAMACSIVMLYIAAISLSIDLRGMRSHSD